MSKIASLSIEKISDNTYQWTISGLSSPFNTTNYIEAGITNTSFSDGALSITGKENYKSATSSGTSTSVSSTFSIFVSATYTFYGYTRVAGGENKYYSAGSTTVTHVEPNPNPRPSDWSWSNISGSGTINVVTNEWVNVVKTEWSQFCNRINEFRVYKELSTVTFNHTKPAYTDSSNNKYCTISSDEIKKAGNAIQDMTWGVASEVLNISTGSLVYVWYFTNLSTALSHIT